MGRVWEICSLLIFCRLVVRVVPNACPNTSRRPSRIPLFRLHAFPNMGRYRVYMSNLGSRAIHGSCHFPVSKHFAYRHRHPANYNICNDHVRHHRVRTYIGLPFATCQVHPMTMAIKSPMFLFRKYSEKSRAMGVPILLSSPPRQNSIPMVPYNLRRLRSRQAFILHPRPTSESRHGSHGTGCPPRSQYHYSPNRGRHSNLHSSH